MSSQSWRNQREVYRHKQTQRDPPDIRGGQQIRGGKEALLWCRVLGELNALLNVALKSLDASLKELLLLLGHTVKDVDGLLGTVGLDRVCQLVVLTHWKIEDLRQVPREWRRTQDRWPWQSHHRQQHRAGRRK